MSESEHFAKQSKQSEIYCFGINQIYVVGHPLAPSIDQHWNRWDEAWLHDTKSRSMTHLL